VKLLGILFDQHLTWNEQVNRIIKSSYGTLPGADLELKRWWCTIYQKKAEGFPRNGHFFWDTLYLVHLHP